MLRSGSRVEEDGWDISERKTLCRKLSLGRECGMPRERQDQGNSSIDLSAEHGQGEAKRLGRAHTTQGLDYPGKDLGLYANQKEKTLWNLKEIGKK